MSNIPLTLNCQHIMYWWGSLEANNLILFKKKKKQHSEIEFENKNNCRIRPYRGNVGGAGEVETV